MRNDFERFCEEIEILTNYQYFLYRTKNMVGSVGFEPTTDRL